MKNIKLNANVQLAQDNLAQQIAKKAGISYPSNHLAVLIASLAPLDDANNNGHRLSAEASKKFLSTVHQAQVNFSHNGKGFVCGAVIDEWIDESTNETKIAFTFYKDLYAEEYTKFLERQAENKVTVSFELDAYDSGMEKLEDGTILISEFEYTGVGLLGVIDNKKPGYSKGYVHEYACDLKDRVSNYKNKELIFAEEIIRQCDEVLNEDDEFSQILDKVVNDVKSEMKQKRYKNKPKKEKTVMTLTEEQKKIVADLRKEYSEFIAEEVTDEQLLDDKVVADIRKKAEEAKQSKEAEKDEKKEDVSAEQKSLSDERYVVERTYNEDGSINVKAKKECTYTWTDSDSETQTESITETTDRTVVYSELLEKVEEIKAEATKELQEKVNTLEAEKTSTIEELTALKAEKEEREAEEKAKKLAEIKASLKGNKYVADFTDEQYLNEAEVNQAKLLQERDTLKAENEALKKTKQTAQDNKDEKDTPMDSASVTIEAEDQGEFPYHLLRKANTRKESE